MRTETHIAGRKEVGNKKARHNFNDQWKTLYGRIASVLPPVRTLQDELEDCPAAKLIGLLPYIVETEAPDRDAFSNLSAYFMARYGKSVSFISNSTKQSPSHMVSSLLRYTGGKQELIQRGEALAALIVLYQYKQSCEQDRLESAYNPLLSGDWDFDSLRTSLEEDIKSAPCRKMDRIVKASELPALYP